MSQIFPKGSTPSERGPRLNATERVGKQASWPITDSSGREVNIRLTPTSTDVSTGTPAVAGLYDFGPVSQASVGRYSASYRDAASATAPGLGPAVHCDFTIQEVTAGVFTATTIVDLETEGGAASGDDDDVQSRRYDATIRAVADATLDTAGADAVVTYFVATAADVTDAGNWSTTAATLVVGNLYVLDAHAASSRVHSLEREF